MDLLNESGFQAAWTLGQIRPPSLSATFVVKGTFDLVPDGIARPCEAQDLLTGDEPFDEDGQVLRYSNDFALFKPRADFLVTGTCRLPGPAPTCPVSIAVGAYSKSLAVIGDRVWKGGVPTEPVPFVSLPVSYDRAFGGPEFARNPAGRGYRDGRLPNVERPDSLIRDPEDRPEPAGFGPLPMTWPQRASKSGTYGKKWQKERWPWFPEDFDWSFFNAAPEDQQLPEYFRGDEEIRIENFHPEHRLLRSKLPGIRVRCFLTELVRTRFRFHEIPMQLDTLSVDADRSRLHLVWRGNRDARDEKLYGFMRLYVVAEKTGDSPRTAEHYQRRLQARLEEPSAAAPAAPPVSDRAPEVTVAVPPPVPDFDTAELERQLQTARSEAPPLPPPKRPPPAPTGFEEDHRAALEQFRSKLVERNRPVPPEIVRLLKAPPSMEIPQPDLTMPPSAAASGPPPAPPEEVESILLRKGSLAGRDLTGIRLAGRNLFGLDFRRAILARADFSGARLDGANFDGAVLSQADLTGIEARKASFRGADLVRASMARADLSEADLTGCDLEGADLTGARLSSASAKEASFAGATLRNAVLAGADLEGANLEESVLHGADFTSGRLVRASFFRAWGRRVRLLRAVAPAAQMGEARLPNADCTELDAPESAWEKAHLSGADFSRARLSKSEFSSALLARAKFPQANLRNARLLECSLRQAELVRCNLFEANLEKADLTGADLRQANLYGAETRDARIDGAAFEQANLKRTKLEAK